MAKRAGRSGGRANDVSFSTDGDASRLLPMAFERHQQGQLDRAGAIYQQILDIEPEHGEALHFFGVLRHQQGHHEEAGGLIRRAIRVNPDSAIYHDNLGTVLESMGELSSALQCYEKAASLEPGRADRSFNMAVVLERLGRLDDAVEHYQAALDQDPEDASTHFNLGNVLKAQGQLEAARDAYQRSIRHGPNTAAYINLGNTLVSLGDPEGATKVLKPVAESEPLNANLMHSLANAERDAGRLHEAVADYRRALSTDADFHLARRGLASALLVQGRPDEALREYDRIDDLNGREDLRAFAVALSQALPGRLTDRQLRRALECLASRDVDSQILAPVLAEHLKPELVDAAERLTLAANQTLLDFLGGAINVDPVFEKHLTRLRRGLFLESDYRKEPYRELVAALGLQCFANEYIWHVSETEADQLAALVQEVCRSPTLEGLLGCALYLPWYRLRPSVELAGVPEGSLAQTLRTRSATEPREEAKLGRELAAFAPIENATSVEVRRQYEDNPYPRWLFMPSQPIVPLAESFARRYPTFQRVHEFDAARELVAGCGTGQEPIASALMRPTSQVLGFDLSTASLAYASRMANKLNVNNVHFLTGDILDLDQHPDEFDVIQCTGVLHHMADPMQGWRTLVRRLTPGGLLKVGLYSRTARRHVISVKDSLGIEGVPRDDRDIRVARACILESQENGSMANIRASHDFYTMSSCRDLLFHTVEHDFGLADIEAAISELKLNFLGFELPNPTVRYLFRQSNPPASAISDLKAWSAFEAAHPDVFEGMYVFWCQKQV